MSEADLEIRFYRPGDEEQILRTFNMVFREVCGPSFTDRTMAQWRWQYLENPVGNRISLAVAKDGTVVSQYAGVPLCADTAFGPQIFVHCVDSMTHPEWRKGLKRPGIFVLTGWPFSAHSREIGDALLYGFPVEMAERIGRKYLEYHFLRVIDFLARDAALPPLPLPPGFTVQQVNSIPGDLDPLYERMRQGKQCLLRRDRSYLDWRYVRNPGRADYELWEARAQGTLRGLLVLRPVHELAPDSCTIADFVAGDASALDALLHTATVRARERDRKRTLAVLPDWSPEADQLRARGFTALPSANWLERRLVYLITGSPITEPFLAERWWYTLGDSDLV
jgi:hypothetical protein